ncbi:MAG: hypothetical protein ACM3Y9_10440 [Ignavibacteria bacterium]
MKHPRRFALARTSRVCGALCLSLILASQVACAEPASELVSNIERGNYGYSLLCSQYNPRILAAMRQMKVDYDKKAATGELSEAEARDLRRTNEMLPMLESFTEFKKQWPEALKDDAARQDYLVRLNGALELCSKMTDFVLKTKAK